MFQRCLKEGRFLPRRLYCQSSDNGDKKKTPNIPPKRRSSLTPASRLAAMLPKDYMDSESARKMDEIAGHGKQSDHVVLANREDTEKGDADIPKDTSEAKMSFAEFKRLKMKRRSLSPAARLGSILPTNKSTEDDK